MRNLKFVCQGLACLLLAACGSNSGGGGASAHALSGAVHGGQSPVTGSAVTLYAAGSGSTGTATVLATGSTNGNGSFSLSGYSCPAADTPVYIVASGGNPGLASGTDNSALLLMAALGACGSSPASVDINELTTVATAYALNGFIGPAGCSECAGVPSQVGNVRGASSGLNNAMSTAAVLVNAGNGMLAAGMPAASDCAASSPPANCALAQKLSSLANTLAACVNTAGPGSQECLALFHCATPGATVDGADCDVPGSSALATDTLTAALEIARNPGLVPAAGVYNVATRNVVFSPALSAAPNDWVLARTLTGGDVLPGTASDVGHVAVDGQGDIWVVSGINNSSITEFHPDGTVFAAAPYTGGGLGEAVGIAIDLNGHAWTANYGSSTLSEFDASGTPLSGSGYSGGGLSNPLGVAIDGSGNVWVANNGPGPFEGAGNGTSISAFNASGQPLSASGYSGGGLAGPNGIAIDTGGNVWVSSDAVAGLSEFSSSGQAAGGSPHTGGGMYNPNWIAVAPDGDLWVGNSNVLSQFAADGTALSSSGYYLSGGINGPDSVAIDANGNVWTASANNDTVNELNASGTALSPGTGFVIGVGQFSGPAAFNNPASLAIDASGNVWVTNTNSGGGTSGGELIELIGAAAPTVTPLVAAISHGFTP